MYCSRFLRYCTCLLLLPVISGCVNSQKMAVRFTTAPNHNKTSEQLGNYNANQMDKFQYDWQNRIDVGNNISLHIAGIEPKTEWKLTSNSFQYQSLRELITDKETGKAPEILYWDYVAVSENGNYPTSKTPVNHKLWQKPKGTVIILPGIYVPKTTMYYWANALSVYGYQTISIDLPGQGLSTGNHILYGNKTAEPIISAIDQLEKQGKLSDNLILLGCSHGAATALHTSALDSRIDKVIAMEPYSNIKKASLDFISVELRIPRLLVNLNKYKIYKAIDTAGEIVGFDPVTETTTAAIKNTKAPVLLIHGSKDKHLPPRHSIELTEAAPDKTTLMIVDGAGHMNLPFYKLNNLVKKVDYWLEDKQLAIN